MKIKLENSNLVLEIERLKQAASEYYRKNLELKCDIENRTKKINIFNKQRLGESLQGSQRFGSMKTTSSQNFYNSVTLNANKRIWHIPEKILSFMNYY